LRYSNLHPSITEIFRKRSNSSHRPTTPFATSTTFFLFVRDSVSQYKPYKMGEIDAISRVSLPATRKSIANDLRTNFSGLIGPGTSLVVHTSLRSIGWVCGGPVALIQALMDVVTDQVRNVDSFRKLSPVSTCSFEDSVSPFGIRETLSFLHIHQSTQIQQFGRIRQYPNTGLISSEEICLFMIRR
jgi:hypothetical protein